MKATVSRRAFLAAAGVAGAGFLVGCGAGSESGSRVGGSASRTEPIVVGTLATEDILPYWAAEAQGLFAVAGLDVSIVVFQSATELIAGVASGEADLAMTDIMVAAGMYAGDIDVRLGWVTLGSDASQGRFGLMVGPDSSIQTVGELAGVPVGVGSNTILEYVMDCLMEDAGVPDDQIVVEELQKLPVRYQAMVSGEVAAAALPASLLALGEANGCRVIADDTEGANISQSVMVVSNAFYDSHPDEYSKLKAVWDDAAKSIDADPESYRELLVDHANLSEAVADTYPLSVYPQCELPTEEMVEPVLAWMTRKGYLTRSLSYDQRNGTFVFSR